MLEILNKMFESSVTFKGKCIDCGCDVIIDIVPTSSGYGLNGGALLKSSTDKCCAKCPDCYKANPKLNDQNSAQR